MATSLFFVFTFISLISGSKFLDEPCDRIRRPFYELSTEERLVYVEGYQTLRQNGMLATITATHHLKHHAGSHHGSNFMFWHSYLVWEVETAIRSLGDKFECFSMPYWDFTVDSGSESAASIFSLSVGNSGGGKHHDYCVYDTLWSNEGVDKERNYWVPHEELCFEDENYPFCCLKREVSQTVLLPTVSMVANTIVSKASFVDFNDELITYHGALHKFVGGNDKCAMATSYASDDPIFFLLHSYIEYLRLMWTSCHQYDTEYDADIDTDDIDIDADMYTPYCDITGLKEKSGLDLTDSNGDDDDEKKLVEHIKWTVDSKTSPCGAIKWGDDMDYFPMDQQEWSLSSRMNIQLKSMFNPKDWGVQYDLGSFYTNSHLNEWCANNLNNEWFVSSVKDKTEQGDQQKFVDKVWAALDANDGMNEEDKFKIAESLSCKWNRENSPNSCWSEQMMTDVIETCADRDIEDGSELTLDDLLSFDGVVKNSCLQRIRREIYDESFLLGEDVNLRLCNGEFDYQCPDYSEMDYIFSVDNGIISVSMNQNVAESNTYFAYLGIFMASIILIGFIHVCRGRPNKKEIIPLTVEAPSYSTF